MGGIWRGGNQENWWSMGEITGFLGGASGKEPACQSRRQEMRGLSLGLEDLLEEGTATHSNVPAWRLPWTEEPGGIPKSQMQLKQCSTHPWEKSDSSDHFPNICSKIIALALTWWLRDTEHCWRDDTTWKLGYSLIIIVTQPPVPAGPKNAHLQADTSQVGGWMDILWRSI